MRLVHLAPALLGLLLIGCGPDEPSERPATPDVDAGEPNRESAPAVTVPGTGEPAEMSTPPADNGSGLGTESGAGVGVDPELPGSGTGTDTGVGYDPELPDSGTGDDAGLTGGTPGPSTGTGITKP